MAHVGSGPFDIFISYSRADNDAGHGWVTALSRFIESESRLPGNDRPRVFIDTENIHSMDDWRDRILAALRHSKVLLVCLSPNYFASDYCQWEWEHFLQRQGPKHLRGEGESIQVVRFAATADSAAAKHPKWLESVRRSTTIDLTPWFDAGPSLLATESEARARVQLVVDTLQERLKATRRELAREYGNLRAANEHFVGRKQQLRDLHEAVGVGRAGVITALHGLGGIGKTELAVHYANEYARSFAAGIWWIDATLGTELKPMIGKLADEPQFPKAPAPLVDGEHRFQFVLSTLRDQVNALNAAESQAGAQVLLLLDNVEHPGLLSASQRTFVGNCPWLSLLVTTRTGMATWANADRLTAIPLDALDPTDALALIREWRPGHAFADVAEQNAASALAHALGYFTLAIEQAAIYLGMRPELPIDELHAKLSADGLTTLDAVAAKEPELLAEMQHNQRLLGLVLDQTLPPANSLPDRLLHYAARWGPDAVPKPWLEDLIRLHHPVLLTKESLVEAWRWITLRRLLTPSVLSELLRMHRLIQAHLLERIAHHQFQAHVDELLLNSQVEIEREMNHRRVDAWRIAALAAWGTDPSNNRKDRLRVTTLAIVAEWASFNRPLLEAAALCLRALTMLDEQVCTGREEEQRLKDTIGCLKTLSRIGLEQGDTQTATDYAERALAIADGLHRADSGSAELERCVETCLNDLGRIFLLCGHVDLAQNAFLRSLRIAERLHSSDVKDKEYLRDLLIAHNNMGEVNFTAGRNDEALQSFLQARDVSWEALATGIQTVRALNDYAVSLQHVSKTKLAMRDTDGAHEAISASVSILLQQGTSGALNMRDYRHLSIALVNLGNVYVTAKKYLLAFSVFKKSFRLSIALNVADQTNSGVSREVSAALSRLGDVFSALNRPSYAERSYLCSLEIRTKLAGQSRKNPSSLRDLLAVHARLHDLYDQIGNEPARISHLLIMDGICQFLKESGFGSNQSDRKHMSEVQDAARPFKGD